MVVLFLSRQDESLSVAFVDRSMCCRRRVGRRYQYVVTGPGPAIAAHGRCRVQHAAAPAARVRRRRLTVAIACLSSHRYSLRAAPFCYQV